MARPKPPLILSDDERQTLTKWAARPKSTQRLALRARIVLACADEPNNTAVAAQLGVCAATVGTWRNRFVAKRLDGLVDEPRPGAPRTVTDSDVERVVTKTLETKPSTATHWSTRGMAKSTGLSQSAKRSASDLAGVRPQAYTVPILFKLSTDPYSSWRRCGMSSGCTCPRRNEAIVLSVDEGPFRPGGWTAPQPVLPMTPAQVERGTHDYVRQWQPPRCSPRWTSPPAK